MEEVNSELKNFVHNYSSLIFKMGLGLVILSTLFLFTTLTTEIFDTPKLLILIIFVGLMLVLLAVKFTIAGKVVLTRTPLDIPLLLLLSVAIVSTVLSSSPFVALLGDQLKIHGSLISLVAYLLFYFILVNSLKSAKEIKWIFTLTIIAAQILAVISLLTFLGVKLLPTALSQAANFTPTGSSFSTTAILALLVPLMVMQILTSKKIVTLAISSSALAISGITIALTGSWATWIGALAGIVATVFIAAPVKNIRLISPISLISLITPLVLIALVAILSFVPPVGGAQNPLYTQARNFPREIQLPFVTSWKVSVSAFRDVPFWGTGPASYSFNFTNYKPIEFNSSKFWNLRFDAPFNEYLQTVANLGGIGLLALVSLTALFISAAYRVILRRLAEGSLANASSSETSSEILRSAQNDNRGTQNDNKVALAISGLIFFIILALHASSLGLWVVGILVLASYMVLNRVEGAPRSYDPGNFKDTILRITGYPTASSTETIRVDALPGTVLSISLGIVLIGGFFGGKIVLADYHHRLALNAISQNQGIVAYNELVAAEKLNPRNDTYRTNLAQTNFALANAIAAAKAPTEASPAGFLTDQDKQNIQLLLQQSISEGRTATTLSPRSSVNWEILALIYRQIAGVAQNALVFSLDSYGRAIFQDPLNPGLRVSVGGVYYAVKNYDLAIRFFTDAINLKPDFPNAYYNLSVALRDKGDLNSAQTIAEKLLTLVDKDSPDYKVVTDYLTDLKNKTATPAQPPAASASGALQDNELPKVIDLPKPEKIATPEAIKKPAPTPTPSESPTPTASPIPTATP